MDPRLAHWLARTHGAPTPAQEQAVPLLLGGHHLLLASPTGSGKTLAAFLAVLTDLARAPLEDRTYCVYVSPLRALVHDMARNLAAPIEGAGLDVRVAIRTGDTPAHERDRQRRKPPHILVTTPESLALILSSPKAREALVGLRWVVVDEVHAIAGSKRGAQLALALERLAAHAGEFQRVGLSATVSPVERVAAFLAGDRPVRTVEVRPRGEPDLEVVMPLDDPIMASQRELDEAVLGIIERSMETARTTLVFTNTRAQAEHLAARLQARHPSEVEGLDAAQDALIATHHGSMSKASRLDVEERLKRAQVRCVVASSSLELGIHADHVDRVILLGSPKSAARTLQRVGRSGHRPGATARATLVVQDPAELPEALALRALARAREVEEVVIPENAFDVLAQHLSAMELDLPCSFEETLALTRRAWCYRSLSPDDLAEVWDRLPRVPRMEYFQNAGTIPESGLLKVFHGDTFVGEVEEDFAAGLQAGDVFSLGGTTWRYLRATPARVLVAPARGGSPTVPEWRGEGISASPLLAAATLSTLSGLAHGSHASSVTESQAIGFLALQAAHAGLPEGALVETFATDAGRRAHVFHAYLGRRANDALARALAHAHGDARPIANDWGFALVTARGWRPSRAALLRLLDAPIEPLLREAIVGSQLLKRRFRHVAARGLLLRRRDGGTLGQRQLDANMILGRLAKTDPQHPLLREAVEECLRDAMDVDAAEGWRLAVVEGHLPLRLVDMRACGSPLAARILAPPGPARREALRDHADRMSYQNVVLSQ